MANRQLPLDFNVVKTYFSKDFVVSQSNKEAYDTVMNWPKWPVHGLILYGDDKVGKTHLSHIFRHRAKAVFLQEENLQNLDQFSRFIYKGSAFILDDAPRFIDQYQTQLFHFCNILKEKEGYALWTANSPSRRWGIQLRDLSSRLSVFPAIKIFQPEDALLEAILVKKTSELQIDIDQAVFSFILTHTERSAAFLISFLERINRVSLVQKRKVTIPLVKEVMRLHEKV